MFEWFVHRPAAILLISLLLLGCDQLDLRWHRGRRRAIPALWLTSMAWLLFAGWEWLVMLVSPEANIRVDLLLIWPILLGLTAVSLVTSLRSP